MYLSINIVLNQKDMFIMVTVVIITYVKYITMKLVCIVLNQVDIFITVTVVIITINAKLFKSGGTERKRYIIKNKKG